MIKPEDKLKQINYTKAGECPPDTIVYIDGKYCNGKDAPLVIEANSKEGWYRHYETDDDGIPLITGCNISTIISYSKNIKILVPENWQEI
jgi:hypothetical protein